jgi:ribosomal-protein-alanine N-acetyltransferase
MKKQWAPALILAPLSSDFLAEAVALDQLTLGGFWGASSYQTELERASSLMLSLLIQPGPPLSCPQLIGMAALWAILEEAHIILMAVHPQYQGQGLGRLLLWGLLQGAQQGHLSHATLEVRASNQRAIALYQTFGFTTVGIRPRYYEDGEDGHILWKKQLQAPSYRTFLQQQYQELLQRIQHQGWSALQTDLGLPPHSNSALQK